jgi:hypothetical protein
VFILSCASLLSAAAQQVQQHNKQRNNNYSAHSLQVVPGDEPVVVNGINSVMCGDGIDGANAT